MDYSVRTTRGAERDIRRLDSRIRRQVLSKIASLGDNPRPQDIKQIRGGQRIFRVGSGEYRILYDIDDQAKMVTISRVRHRREVYRNL